MALSEQSRQHCRRIGAEFTADIIEHRVREVTSQRGAVLADALHPEPFGKADRT